MLELILASLGASGLFIFLSAYNRKIRFTSTLTDKERETQDAISLAFLILAVTFIGFTFAVAKTSIIVNEAYYGSLNGMSQLRNLMDTCLIITATVWFLLFALFIIRFVIGYLKFLFNSLTRT